MYISPNDNDTLDPYGLLRELSDDEEQFFYRWRGLRDAINHAFLDSLGFCYDEDDPEVMALLRESIKSARDQVFNIMNVSCLEFVCSFKEFQAEQRGSDFKVDLRKLTPKAMKGTNIRFKVAPNKMGNFYAVYANDKELLICLNPNHSFFRSVIKPLMDEELEDDEAVNSKNIAAILDVIAAWEFSAWGKVAVCPEDQWVFEEHRNLTSTALSTLVED